MIYKHSGDEQKDSLEKSEGSIRLKNIPSQLLASTRYLSNIGMALQTMVQKFSKGAKVRHEMQREESVHFASW
ncbi:MAG: hypothetical protein GY822_15385 [Deltaproteobacteria bacterium]|nr:hypothetical protein [Deltaproteobacteria bacterium]